MTSRRRTLGLALALSVAACETPPPAQRGDAPEPSEALRPEGERGEVPAEARIADYEIDARLDDETHRITGTVRITWHNRTTRSVTTLPFHLYMNAFRAEDTAWMREARGSHRGQRQGEEGRWGYIDITRVTLLGAPQASDLEVRAGEPRELRWAEDEDPSTMTVTLPGAIGPGESAVVELDFVTQLPEVFARTGYAGTFHMVGQWYPKLAVLDPQEGWRNHVFTLQSEFFADFGDYEVTLDVPAAMVVGATGIQVSDEPGEEGRRRLRYRAEMVHDFAWAADPDLLEVRSEWHGIRIRQLMRAEHAADADRHEAALVATLESMEARFGPYPWSTITVIHPPSDAGGAQGMEYPTLFTTSPVIQPRPWWRLLGLEERASGVFTTIHEFGHQYFQGLLASDEFREPWLDEGMNTTSNALALRDWQADDPWVVRLGGQRIDENDMTRLALTFTTSLDPVRAPADRYLELSHSYGGTVYRKTGATMLTLRNLAGAPAFDAALRAYADRWRFRHPRGDDLVAALVEGIGAAVDLGDAGPDGPVRLDVADFLDQALRGTDEVDFALTYVDNRRRIGHAGWHRDEEGALVGGDDPPPEATPIDELDDAEVEATVQVRRAGGLRMPVELEVEFSDGASERIWWDGQERYHVFAWPGRRIRRARLDPDDKLILEGHRLNNLRYAPGEAPPAGDGLSAPLTDGAEALTLALMGGMSL
ncbi:MAG: M1 family metallopeptidase [Myxococcales bacterium]|nr:M1 family metallopeptidase [Myxococcales bacterium]